MLDRKHQEVLELVKERINKAEEISYVLNRDKAEVKSLLHSLRKRGFIKTTRNSKRWQLTKKGRNFLERLEQQ